MKKNIDDTKIPLFGFGEELDAFKIYSLAGSNNSGTNLPHIISVPHRHDYFELLVFTTAGGYHLIDFEKNEILKESIHFVAPAQVHLIYREPMCKGFLLAFSKSFLAELLDQHISYNDLPYYKYGCNPIMNLKPSFFAEILELTNKISDEYISDHLYRYQLIKSYLNIILIKTKALYEAIYEKPIQPNNSYRKLFLQFQELVDEQYRLSAEVNYYASLINISPGHLNKISKNVTGRNAYDHIKEKILLEAKRLLAVTDLTQKEIAVQLGFNDVFYFNRYFKKNIGLAPGQFRIQQQGIFKQIRLLDFRY